MKKRNALARAVRAILLRLLAVVCMIAAAVPAADGAKIHLVDGKSGERLVLASILDKKGNVVALTDADGAIPVLSSASFPVTFTYIGYEPLELKRLPDKDVPLDRKEIELSEITVTPGSRPLLHLTGYLREYASSFGSSDSLTIYREAVADFLIPVEKTKVKGWRSPRILADNRYMRQTDSKGLDSVSDRVDDLFLWASMTDIFPASGYWMTLPEQLAKGSESASATVIDKDKVRHDWLKRGDVTRVNIDVMTKFDGHVYSPAVLKVLGATTDFTEMTGSYVFIDGNGDGRLSPSELSRVCRSLKMTGRGKLWKWAGDSKTPMDMRSYIEIYVTDGEYLTEAEAKELKKNPPFVDSALIEAPAEAPALHSGVRTIVDRIKAKH